MSNRNPLRERRQCLATLGLTEGSSEDDIKKAYKKLALQYHPDKNESDDAKEKFQEIGYAYKYLTEGPSSVDGDSHGVPADILIRLFEEMFMPRFFGFARHHGPGFHFAFVDSSSDEEEFLFCSDDDDDGWFPYGYPQNQRNYNNTYSGPSRGAQTEKPPNKKKQNRKKKRGNQSSQSNPQPNRSGTPNSESNVNSNKTSSNYQWKPGRESHEINPDPQTSGRGENNSQPTPDINNEEQRPDTPTTTPNEAAQQRMTKKQKKKLQADQRKREQEMEKIAAEILEKQQKEKEKLQREKEKQESKLQEDKENESFGWLDDERKKSRRARRNEKRRQAAERGNPDNIYSSLKDETDSGSIDSSSGVDRPLSGTAQGQSDITRPESPIVRQDSVPDQKNVNNNASRGKYGSAQSNPPHNKPVLSNSRQRQTNVPGFNVSGPPIYNRFNMLPSEESDPSEDEDLLRTQGAPPSSRYRAGPGVNASDVRNEKSNYNNNNPGYYQSAPQHASIPRGGYPQHPRGGYSQHPRGGYCQPNFIPRGGYSNHGPPRFGYPGQPNYPPGQGYYNGNNYGRNDYDNRFTPRGYNYYENRSGYFRAQYNSPQYHNANAYVGRNEFQPPYPSNPYEYFDDRHFHRAGPFRGDYPNHRGNFNMGGYPPQRRGYGMEGQLMQGNGYGRGGYSVQRGGYGKGGYPQQMNDYARGDNQQQTRSVFTQPKNERATFDSLNNNAATECESSSWYGDIGGAMPGSHKDTAFGLKQDEKEEIYKQQNPYKDQSAKNIDRKSAGQHRDKSEESKHSMNSLDDFSIPSRKNYESSSTSTQQKASNHSNAKMVSRQGSSESGTSSLDSLDDFSFKNDKKGKSSHSKNMSDVDVDNYGDSTFMMSDYDNSKLSMSDFGSTVDGVLSRDHLGVPKAMFNDSIKSYYARN